MKLLVVLLLALPLVMGGGDFQSMFDDLMKKHGGDDKPEKNDMSWSGQSDGDKKEDGNFMETFKKWFKGEQQKEEQKQEYKEYIKENLAEFHQYLEKVKEKEMQEKKQKMAVYKQMQAIKLKKMKIYEMKSLTEEFEMQKMKLKFGVFYQMLTFCDCEDYLMILKRLKYGKFGSMGDEDDDDNNNMGGGMGGDGMGGDGMGGRNGTDGGMGGNMGGDMGGDMGSYDDKSIAEAAQWIMQMDKMERVKTIVGHGYKVMCGAAKQYLKRLAMVEGRFRQLRGGM